ncbi:MAG: hypothetical protein RSE00_04160 [Clostridia bacterium]
MSKISNFIDPELFAMVGAILLAIILLKLMYRFLSGFRVVKMIVTIGCIVGVLFMLVQYIQKNEEVFSNQPHNFVYGQVNFAALSMDKLELESIRTNFPANGKGKILVKISSSTEILDKTTTKTVKLKKSELKNSDTLQIYCKENLIDSEKKEVTAIKIIRKHKPTKAY